MAISGWSIIARLFFPAWRFFDEMGESPRLFVRGVPGSDGSGAWPEVPEVNDWQPADLPVARGFAGLFVNPRGNLQLAQFALLERLLRDIADAPGPPPSAGLEASVSYRLVDRWALACVVQRGLLGPTQAAARGYQFKITVGDPRSPDADVLVSPIRQVPV